MPAPLRGVPSSGPRRIWPAGLASALLHGAIVGLIVLSLLRHKVVLVEPPDLGARVELVIGNGGDQPGTAAQPAPEVPKTPQPAPKAEPPKPEPPKPEPPLPEPPKPQPPPPPLPPNDVPAVPQPAPPPPPPPETPQPEKPAPPMQPPPPPPPAPPTPKPEPAIRLGSGFSPPPAEIEGPLDTIQPGADMANTVPVYPVEAARRREHGAVVLELSVDETGAVTDVQILQSSGSNTLDTAARTQLAKWHYRPAIKDGHPVATTVRQIIDFKL
jgi:protein TonB